MKMSLDTTSPKQTTQDKPGYLLKLFSKSNILVIGASQCGKTTAVLRFIRDNLISDKAVKIFFLYAAHQPFMDKWNMNKSNPPITFIKGLKLDVLDRVKGHKILVIDDLIMELDRSVVQHFIAGSHHKNVTTFFISHALYMRNEHWRIITENSQYMLLFKNKSRTDQASPLGRQILLNDKHRLEEAYKSLAPYKFVLLSYHPRVPEQLLVITEFFSKCPNVFM